jgi:hypothetical protein
MKRFTILAVGLAGLGLAGCAQGPSSGLSDAGATISASSAVPGNLAPASSDHMQGVESRKHHAGQAPYHASDNLLSDAKQAFAKAGSGWQKRATARLSNCRRAMLKPGSGWQHRTTGCAVSTWLIAPMTRRSGLLAARR